METDDLDIHEISKKTRKPYAKREKQDTPAPISIPQPPNPAIIQMEVKISELVELRMQANFNIQRATQQLRSAQLSFESAKDEVSRIESEINYRQAIVNQMRGGTAPVSSGPYHPQSFPPPQYQQQQPMQQSPMYAPSTPYPPYPAPMGVSSYPAPNQGLYPDVVGNEEGAQTGNADAVRREEFRTRGY